MKKEKGTKAKASLKKPAYKKILHDYCKNCQKCRVAKIDGPIGAGTTEPLYKAGDFIVRCTGIPGDDKFIPKYDAITQNLTAEEIREAQGLYDPIIWAEDKLGWKPRRSKQGDEYQKLILRCNSPRKVLRMGRRLGKSEILAISALHFLYTNSPKVQRWDADTQSWVDGYSTVLVLTPYLSQIKLIFARIRQLIDKNPELKSEVKRDVSTPFHEIELYNGAKIVGFSSGAKSGGEANTSRGQKADFIILDEMDYLSEGDIETIIALIMEHGSVRLLASSTPSGKREFFYSFCMDRMDFKEFHYTSMHNPAWSPVMEAELRTFYKTEMAWLHEIMAEFGESAHGVFQHKYVDAAQEDYEYSTQKPIKNWTYSIGVDWNDTVNGTKLCVVGWDPDKEQFKIVDKRTVQKVGWTQTAAIDALIQLNRMWKPTYIYVDEGYGATQIEVIKQFGLDARYRNDQFARIDEKLQNIVGINSSSKLEVFDPVTGEEIKKLMKPFMVENTVRRFERQQVKISIHDEDLYRQLIGYTILKVSAAGAPVYEAGPDGDHDLDAFILALLAFQMELSELTNRKYSTEISFSGRIGEGLVAAVNNRITDPGRESFLAVPRAPLERTEIKENKDGLPAANTEMAAVRMYSAEAFSSDDDRYTSRKRTYFTKRAAYATSRTKF